MGSFGHVAFFGQPAKCEAAHTSFRLAPADRNSRTCFAGRSARRDDCRRDVGRDRAKKAAKMKKASDWSWAGLDDVARICAAEGSYRTLRARLPQTDIVHLVNANASPRPRYAARCS